MKMIYRQYIRASVGNSLMPFSGLCSDTESSYTVPSREQARGGGSEMQDHYDSYGIRETEVAIEEFVNRLVELYPHLDPLRASELISEQVENLIRAANREEQY
jgi:hypothetical protein